MEEHLYPLSCKLFQLTAARRRLGRQIAVNMRYMLFQLTAARRRLEGFRPQPARQSVFQLTAARRRLGPLSTPKQSTPPQFQLTAARRRLGPLCWINPKQQCFNSQPPEGGWFGGLGGYRIDIVSTHSRPKAAG